MIPVVAYTQSCDLSDLDCSKPGRKCDIHFDNRTGLAEYTGKKSKSYSNALTVKIRARDADKKKLENSLGIRAGQKNTINLSNSIKSGMVDIRASSQCNFYGDELSGGQIRTILKGTGKCKIRLHKLG